MSVVLFALLSCMILAGACTLRPSSARAETGDASRGQAPSTDNGCTAVLATLRRGFDICSEMMFLRDRQGRFALCNEAFTLVCGRSEAEILGKTVHDLELPPTLVDLFCRHDQDVLDTGKTYYSEVSSAEQGRLVAFENRSYPDFAPDGSVRGIFNVCRDVAPDKATAEALEYQSALLQATNDAAMLLFSDDEELDELAVRALGCIGSVTCVDQVDVWRNHGSSDEGLLCTRVYNWNKAHAPSYFSPHSNTAVYSAHLPGWEALLSIGESVDTQSRPSSKPEREHLEHQGLKAVLAVPIIFRSSFWGFIRLGVSELGHNWERGEEASLRSVGLLLAATMQRRQIQEALSESEERFRDVTMAAGEIIWELNAQGYFSYISERMFALTGYHPEEVRGMRWEDFAMDGHGEELTGRMFQASVPTGSFRAFEHRIRSKDGAIIWLFTSGKLLIGPEGIAGLRGTSLDVSHDKQTTENLNTTLGALENANKELERAADHALELARKAESVSKAKSEFLANMSHEVRTPLNAIIGMAYLMQKTSMSVKQEDYINKIHTAGVTLLGVVNDILDFSNIESGKLEIEHVPFELESLFENLAFVVGARAEEQGLDMAFSIRRDVPRRLVGDPLRIGQVLTNIVGNAVKFTKEGCVDVRCSVDKIERGRAHLRIVVRDTGIGISQEQQRLLFQSFSQVDSSITRRYGGTGLGLAISKNLLELSEGNLVLESEEGKGTTITVFLPLGIDIAKTDFSADPENCPLADLSVTLVEPHDLFREHLVGMLEDMGCRVAAFSDIGQGFAAIASSDAGDTLPRVLILPMRLVEEENGSHIRHLRENMHLTNAPRVLAIAPFGYTEDADTDGLVRPSLQQDIFFLTRPVLSTALKAALSDMLSSWENGSSHSKAQSGSSLVVPYFPDSRVLLVEDNPINQQIAIELLREAGVSVTVAENGRIAVELLENSPVIPFDLIFMDLQMPEMDGFTATERIRANPRLAFLPIIAMTAHATVEERLRCLEAGMSEHLSKPIDVAALYDILLTWLKPSQKKKMSLTRSIDDSPLPELPGLDVEDVLKRMDGDVRLYKIYLLQFCLHHADEQNGFGPAMSQDEIKKAHTLVASMKQHAELIGAGRLITVIDALQDALARDEQPGEDVFREFQRELEAIIEMLRSLFPEPPVSDISDGAPAIDEGVLLSGLARLNVLLLDDDAAACQLFNELEPLIKKVNNSAAVTAAKALSMFDFSLALSVLAPMEKNLSSEQTDLNQAVHE